MLFIISLLIAIGSAIAWINARKKFRDERNLMFKTTSTIMGSLAIIFLLIYRSSQCFTQIPAGHVGVVDFFGVVSDRYSASRYPGREPNGRSRQVFDTNQRAQGINAGAFS